LVACGLVVAPPLPPPRDVPPACDRIPEAAWIPPWGIPLNSHYAWPRLPGVAVTAVAPRFRFEELCASPPVLLDPRSWAVAERALVVNPEGQWQLQAQVLHWRVRRGVAVNWPRRCSTPRPGRCGLVGPRDGLALGDDGRARPDGGGDRWPGDPAPVPGRQPREQHDHRAGDVVDGAPADSLAGVDDTAVLDAMGAPLCAAYIGSCQ
jgi:hypothetical protein